MDEKKRIPLGLGHATIQYRKPPKEKEKLIH